MNRNAVRHAETALGRAAKALDRLRAGNELEEIEEAWDHFLQAASKVYEKIKAGARGDQASWRWFGGRVDQRRDDPLLSYVHHARNSDHHRFEEVVERREPSTTWGATGGAVHITGFKEGSDGLPEAIWTPANPGASITVERFAAHLLAVPVIDRGVEYDVPTSHCGQRLPDRNVITIAEHTLSYLQGMVSEAASLIR